MKTLVERKQSMIRFWEKVLQDLRDGRNLEIYLTLVVALALLVLDIFGIVTSEAVAAGILTTLVLLAFSTLTQREQMQDLMGVAEQALSGQPSAEEFFWKKNLLSESDFEEASFVGIAGITLNRTIGTYYDILKSRLISGAHIQIITIDPVSEAPQQAVYRSGDIFEDTFFTVLLHPTINRLSSLVGSAASSSTLELGLLPFIPSFGLTLLDPDKPHGRIIVEIYQHKSSAFHPTFELTPRRDKYWYTYFREQFDLLWESCGERKGSGGQIRQFREDF
jgi:hypothetical protein